MKRHADHKREQYERDMRTTLLVVRAKLREALALSRTRRGGR